MNTGRKIALSVVFFSLYSGWMFTVLYPTVSEGEPLPTCSSTGKRYTAPELIDLVAKATIRATKITKICKVQYESVEELYRKNPNCCDIDLQHYSYGRGEEIKMRWLPSEGYVVGSVRVGFLCRNFETDPALRGDYAVVEATVTSCGIITEFGGGKSEKFVGRYPERGRVSSRDVILN